VKLRHIFLIVLLVLVADQGLKFWVKTHFYMFEDRPVLGSWFRLHFIENEGMAWGLKFGGSWGKMALTLFRMAAVIFGIYYIRHIIRKKYHRGFIICAGLILAGAIGNLIDSMFYGLIFSASPEWTSSVAQFMPKGGGYAGFLHGKVVDMLYFPIIKNVNYPSWFPFGLANKPFEFFSPVFNLADASISIGVFTILLNQKRFFKRKPEETHPVVETSTVVNDEVQTF
jgi:signal peptidase II